MEKRFDPARAAERWYPVWEREGYFKPAEAMPEKGAKGAKKPFCIILPPPNVTGTLHMGHGFQVSLMDALIRYHRMLGEDVLWQGGVDHAGIATQMVVERQLEAQQQSRTEMGRDEFVRRVWAWKEESGGVITRQLRRLGASIDWSRERFTMDVAFSDAVAGVFVRLHKEGLIYRDKRLVNWDPVLLTALSDLEVVSEEEAGTMYHVRYPFADGDTGNTTDGGEGIVIATTRPETILVDGAIAVHPDDERFRPLLGKKVLVPMTDPPRAIEIIADAHVDAGFGSGCVKITPAHDFNDYEVWQRHPDKNIPMLQLMTPDARLNENAPKPYRGLDRYQARERIVADLRKAGLLLRADAHKYQLPRGDRSGAVLEPMLTEQWFVKMDELADRALQAVDKGDTRFVPDQWRNTFNAWLGGIRDWCISRQLWWGHRIPAWYDDQGRCWVAADEAAARDLMRQQTGDEPGEMRRDDSVLDTWFSSALWSFVPLGWPDSNSDLRRWHPTTVLVTGFDIIFFWVARMMMMSLHLLGEVPFRQVFVHGLVLDMRGQKMSKSKGNILDPIDLIDGIGLEELLAKRTAGLMQPQMRKAIEERTRKDFPQGLEACGADALRFTFCALATTGRNVHFDTSQIEGYRNFCNKLWNAARFVLRRLEEADTAPGRRLVLPEQCVGLPQRWILSRLQATIAAVRQGLDSYRLDLAAQALYDFVWHQYCDWYLECAKTELNSERDGRAVPDSEILAVMAHVLEQLLRLAHPFMPFITEELWQKFAPFVLADVGPSIMLSAFPEACDRLADAEAEADFDLLIALVGEVRNLRGETGIHPGAQLPLIVQEESAREAAWRREYAALFCSLAGTDEPQSPPAGGKLPPCTSLVVGGLHWLVPIGNLIDAEQERKRLAKAIAQMEVRMRGYQAKLDNDNFVSRAPESLVQGTQRQLREASDKLDRLRLQLSSLSP